MHRAKNLLLGHIRISARMKDLRISRAAACRMSTMDGVESSVIVDRVLGLVKRYDRIDAAKVTEKADFQKDLGLDSLDRVELVMALEQEFAVDIPEEKADKLGCCSDVVDFLVKEVGVEKLKSPTS